MLLQLWRSTTLARSSAWMLQSSRFSSFSSHNNTTSASRNEDSPRSFWLALKKEDPDMFRTLQALKGTITKEFYARMRAKPKVHQLYLEHQRARFKRQYATADFRNADIQRSRNRYQARKSNEDFVRQRKVYMWCFHAQYLGKHSWAKDLPWKTHRPVRSAERVSHHCAGCGIRRLGVKSWWQSIDYPSSFLCNKHYTARGWSECMPKGYEDVRTFRDFRARYEQLNPK